MKNILLALFLVMSSPHVANAFLNEEILKTQAAAKVKSILSDPDSASFQNIRVITNSKGEESVCGEVNAKNKFGGYVGFSPFSYSENNVTVLGEDTRTEEFSKYYLTGCAGPEKELIARVENEASFNCRIIWNLIVNVVVNQESKDAALDASMTAVKNRAKENGAIISPEQEIAIRTQFSQSLEQTLSNKQQVNSIKKSFKYQEYGFVETCVAGTVSLFKTQAGVK